MRAHLVQLDIVWEDPQMNFARVRSLLRGASVDRGDLVVLPELFAVGFSLDLDKALDHDGQTRRFLGELSFSMGCTVQGGRGVLAPDGKGRNLMSVFGPDGQPIAEYAKIHPFSFGREPQSYCGGDEVVVYPWNGLTACPVVCYDLRFPELFREGLAMGAEVFAVGANWPEARQEHWRALLIARAIENQAFALGVNRTGRDPHLSYRGGSIVVDPRGRVLGELGNGETVLSVEIDPGLVRGWREEFPAWRDQRLGVWRG